MVGRESHTDGSGWKGAYGSMCKRGAVQPLSNLDAMFFKQFKGDGGWSQRAVGEGDHFTLIFGL